VTGTFAIEQVGGHTEELPDDHPDIIDFNQRNSPEAIVRERNDRRALLERRVKELRKSGALEDRVAALELLLDGG
jgi:hypothetical protein